MTDGEHSFQELSPGEVAERAGYESITALAKASLYGRETSVPVCGTCDCRVEPDGECQHGYPSALREAGLI